MVERFFHSDRDVTAALQKAVATLPRILLVTKLSGARDRPVEEMTPFREILGCAGDRVTVLAVIDEGLAEGMWRDPMGELCEKLLPSKADAAVAAAGYLLTGEGHPLAWFRKALWDPREDAEVVTRFLVQLFPKLTPYVRPELAAEERRDTPKETPAVDPRRRDTPVLEMPAVEAPEEAAPPEPPPPLELDAWAIIGVPEGSSFDVVRAAYRKHMRTYHPDKVATLSAEVREEAESKARDLNLAWEHLKKLLGA